MCISALESMSNECRWWCCGYVAVAGVAIGFGILPCSRDSMVSNLKWRKNLLRKAERITFTERSSTKTYFCVCFVCRRRRRRGRCFLHWIALHCHRRNAQWNALAIYSCYLIPVLHKHTLTFFEYLFLWLRFFSSSFQCLNFNAHARFYTVHIYFMLKRCHCCLSSMSLDILNRFNSFEIAELTRCCKDASKRRRRRKRKTEGERVRA